ncbi:MAG: DUF2062 domain-containing protein [Sphingobacterium sp.]
MLQANDSPEIKAMSLALGLFIGIIPVWGFQTVLCLSLAAALRLNIALAFLGSNISIPPMIPVIVFLALKIGGWILPLQHPAHFNLRELDGAFIQIHLLQYVLGSFLLAIFVSVGIGALSYLLLKFYSRKAKKDVQ